MIEPYILYTVGLSLALLWGTYFIASRFLLASSKRRLKRVEGDDLFETFATESPVEEQGKVELRRAKESIRAHFRNTKRLLFPGFVFMTLIAASMPFLSVVPATLVSVLLGAATVTAGVAIKPVVENFVAGLVMGFSKVLNIGDTVVINEKYATVEDISLTHTSLKIWNWQRHIIPNSKMLQLDFLNYTVVDSFLWAHVELWVSYDADLGALEELGKAAARESQYFADYEDPAFFVMETSKESVQIWLAAWADNPSDGWMLKSDMRLGLINAMKTLGLAPHQYHIVNNSKAPSPVPLSTTGI